MCFLILCRVFVMHLIFFYQFSQNVSKGLVNQRYFFHRQQNIVYYRIAHGLYRSKLEG